jgi:DNA-binding NtrC family response regulator
MNPLNGVAQVLLIADDRDSGECYRNALAAGGYDVTQVESFVEVLDSPMPEHDVIVLCDLAIFAYPAQNAQVLRIPAEMMPAALVLEVHRRVALRAALHATIAQAA